MTEFADDWALWQFECEEAELFDHLNDPGNGVALVKMSDGIDPQGLVDKFASEVIERKLLDHEDATHKFVPFWSAKDLVRRQPGYFHAVSVASDETAMQLEEARNQTFQAIGEIANKALLPHTSSRNIINTSAERIFAKSFPERQSDHTDSNFLTAFLGASASGHVMTLPDHTEVEITKLPSGYVLLTRQREWGYLYPDFNLADGISHRVDYEPTTDEPMRAVGLHFIGK